MKAGDLVAYSKKGSVMRESRRWQYPPVHYAPYEERERRLGLTGVVVKVSDKKVSGFRGNPAGLPPRPTDFYPYEVDVMWSDGQVLTMYRPYVKCL